AKKVNPMNDQTDQTLRNTTALTVSAASVDEAEALHYLGEAVREFLPQSLPYAKYAQGKYSYGRDKVAIPLGTKVTALAYEARHSAEKWEGRELLGRKIGKVASSFKVPNVDDLNGNPIPGVEKLWKHCVYLPWILPDDTVVYWNSPSAGGRRA